MNGRGARLSGGWHASVGPAPPLHWAGKATRRGAIGYDVYSPLHPLSAKRLAWFESPGTVTRLPEAAQHFTGVFNMMASYSSPALSAFIPRLRYAWRV
jgi:hypothetical protein